jgi:hypothetical protein
MQSSRPGGGRLPEHIPNIDEAQRELNHDNAINDWYEHKHYASPALNDAQPPAT